MNRNWKIFLTVVAALFVLSMCGQQQQAKDTLETTGTTVRYLRANVAALQDKLSDVQSQLDRQKRELSDLRSMLERLRR